MNTNGNKQRFHLTTFGCQMNQADAQRIRGILIGLGYEETDKTENASLILFNTCCVRQHAVQRLVSRVQALTKLKKKNPSLLIGISGCVAQNQKELLAQHLPMVDLVFGPNDIESLPLLLQKAKNAKAFGNFTPKGSFDGETASGIVLGRPFSAMVNIVRGCTNFCSYCIVPYVRGPEVSRPINELIEFITDLAQKGVKEVTVLGQNVNVYGKDLGIQEGFATLLEEIQKIDGIKWIRFLTSHPKDFSDESIKRISKLSKVCEQFHLPFQAGSNRILKEMRRGYTREQYLELVSKVRALVPGVALSTDIICGFPSETEDEFEETLELVKRIRYEAAFMYYYSLREGTRAASMEGHLDDKVKKARLAKLIEVQNKISTEESLKLIGKEFEVLADSISSRVEGHLLGKTRTGRPIDFKADKSLIGEFVRVRVTKTRIWTVSGELC